MVVCRKGGTYFISPVVLGVTVATRPRFSVIGSLFRLEMALVEDLAATRDLATETDARRWPNDETPETTPDGLIPITLNGLGGLRRRA